jgi:hypothetical protein
MSRDNIQCALTDGSGRTDDGDAFHEAAGSWQQAASST